jgi:hypothetical protein
MKRVLSIAFVVALGSVGTQGKAVPISQEPGRWTWLAARQRLKELR